MPKICKAPECTYNQFGGGYCQRHQYMRKDKKPKQLARRSSRVKVKAPDFGYTSQLEMFKDIYWKAEKPVICPISGRNITKCIEAPVSLFVSHFAHILPKGTYTYWKLNPRNVMMVHPEVHHILDQGTVKDRAKDFDWRWKLWDFEVERAEEEYVTFLRENYL